jgi:hypothetical protein
VFKCGKCNKLSAPGEKQKRVVVQKRQRNYTNYNPRVKQEKVTVGWEIVKELGLCSSCYSTAVV